MNEKYVTALDSLMTMGYTEMSCRGNSMLPILKNPSHCFYVREDSYEVGDIVFCKVKGRYIDAHKITKIRADGAFMIANNSGFENGWTSNVYGRVYRATFNNGKDESYFLRKNSKYVMPDTEGA